MSKTKFQAPVDKTGHATDPFIREAFIYKVYDGDTVYYHANLGYGVFATFQIGRMIGVWAEELKPLENREAGTAAKDHLIGLLQKYAINRNATAEDKELGMKVWIQSYAGKASQFEGIPKFTKEKYGRWLVTIYGVDDDGKQININQQMVADGFATAVRDE